MNTDIEPDGVFQNHKGSKYEVVAVANQHAEGVKQKVFPITVVYRSLDDGKIWARSIAYFNRVMTAIDS